MARITSYSSFIKGEDPKYIQPKPYIYVLKYILGKEGYFDELKDYILNYSDDNSDYEDDKTYDAFMKTLKIYAMEDKFDEIEELVFNHNEIEYDDFDESDDDFEEKMYYKDGFAKNQEIYFDTDDSPVSDIIEDFIDDSEEAIYDYRLEELDRMESELFDDEDLSDVDIDDEEFSDLEDIDSEINGIDIDYKEISNSENDCEDECDDAVIEEDDEK